MFTITKQFSFSASHILHGLPEGHKCGQLHGHNYIVEMELRSATLNSVGFVRDYRELDEFKHFIDDKLDHRHLNDVMCGLNPTAENMACWLYHLFSPTYPELRAVRVSETAKTWAEYRSTVKDDSDCLVSNLPLEVDHLDRLEKVEDLLEGGRA